MPKDFIPSLRQQKCVPLHRGWRMKVFGHFSRLGGIFIDGERKNLSIARQYAQ
jgi:hypothetical protein